VSESLKENGGARPQGGAELARGYIAVRLQVLLVGLLLVAAVGLLMLVANSVVELSRESNALILALAIYVVLPVGLVVLAVRSHLKSLADRANGKDG